jgi:hypothetical protein
MSAAKQGHPRSGTGAYALTGIRSSPEAPIFKVEIPWLVALNVVIPCSHRL